MEWLKTAVSRARGLFGKRQLDNELDEELSFHLEMEAEENVRNGMTPDEARRQARLRFGGVEGVKEDCRDTRAIPFVESLLQDVRFAVRSFRRDPGFTATVLVALVLGIGIGTAMFAVVNGVLIQPLPYEEPDRLVAMWREEQGTDGQVGPRRMGRNISSPDFRDWRDESGLFESALNIDPSRTGFPELGRFLHGAYVDGDLCKTLGVKPLLGRCLAPDEAKPDPDVIVLLHHTWTKRFGANPHIVGQHILVGSPNSRPVVVVGVMPPGYRHLRSDAPHLWLPDRGTPADDQRRVGVAARLATGVSLGQAQVAMDTLAAQRAEAFPETNGGWGVRLVPLHDSLTGDLRRRCSCCGAPWGLCC